jgi:phosphatidylserine/phosphatidylglycerophosphate/cardiolipin synthase-like enzyme
VETPAERSAWFGSFNYNPRSRYLNHELLVRSRDPQLFAALAARFEAIAAEMA